MLAFVTNFYLKIQKGAKNSSTHNLKVIFLHNNSKLVQEPRNNLLKNSTRKWLTDQSAPYDKIQTKGECLDPHSCSILFLGWGTKTKTVKILQQKVGLAIFKSYSRATAILERVSRATGWLGFWRVSLGAEVGEVLSVFGGDGGGAAGQTSQSSILQGAAPIHLKSPLHQLAPRLTPLILDFKISTTPCQKEGPQRPQDH